MTKEELEKQKLKVEIEQIRKPFWKNPTLIISFLTVIISATIGFSSYFTKVNQDNITKIEELQELTKKQEALERKIELQNLNLQKTQIENRAKQLQTNLDKINANLMKLESSLLIKNQKLSKLTTNLEKEKKRNKNYFETVEKITLYMADYGPGYAKGVLSSTSGKNKIKQITEIANKKIQAKEIEKFTNDIVSQTFRKYLTKKNNEIRLIYNN
ncbi:hypothetical protein N9J10_01585 [Flavobacteriaceae bacterium]|jgi:hypothetical protein|nr:hypothetical protein [Flavobacteriaceae bacterium]MDG1384935.1 hypothetical protein [Flavobacteriaceae bacterium]